MIVRSRPHWLHMLFVLRGSILPSIAPQLIATTLFAIFVTFIHGQVLHWKVSLNFVPFSLIGVTLAIFLGFRNSTAYARFWEARTLWGTILNDTRSLARQSLTLTSAPETAPTLVYRLCVFIHTLRHQLRDTDPTVDVQRFLPSDECERLAKAHFKPAIALLMASEWLGERLRLRQVEPPVVQSFEASLSQLSHALGGCERIASTPIPFTYSVIIHRCVYLYCFWLPFGLLDSIGLMTPVIVCFIAYTFFALEALGAELEDPFGMEANDLALDGMSYMIESTLMEMLGEQPRTDKPAVHDYILN